MMTPNPKLAITPHACQSQSPAHVLREVKASGEGNAEGSEVDMVDEADIEDVDDIDVDEVDKVDIEA